MDSTYQAGLTTARTGIVVVIGVGVLLVAAAVALQLYLMARCRRMINPALVAARWSRSPSSP